MNSASRDRILEMLDDGALVLDVGGWAKPLPRADWVIDLLPYDTRGMYGASTDATERFSSETWVVRDICSREPWPFEDSQFDFVICSHTLEDIRDPVWVCEEIGRVGKAGYVEVPSRLEEQSFGVHGPWVGWAHHHWLVDEVEGGLEFVFKSHALHGQPDKVLPRETHRELADEERIIQFFWERGFTATERVFVGAGEIDRYLAEPIRRMAAAGRIRESRGGLRQLLGRLRRG